jgi:hypothetical protein
MARRIPSLRPAFSWIAIVAFLALCVTTLVSTPSSTQAKPSSPEINPPGGGSGGLMIPGHGDDDQPTMAPPASRRRLVSVSESNPSGGGSGDSDRGSFIDLVRRLFLRGQVIIRRLANIVP